MDQPTIGQGKKRQYVIKYSKSYPTGPCKLYLERTCGRQTLPVAWYLARLRDREKSSPAGARAEIYLDLTKIEPKSLKLVFSM